MSDERRDAAATPDELPDLNAADAADPKGGVLIGLLLPYKPVAPVNPVAPPNTLLGDGSVRPG